MSSKIRSPKTNHFNYYKLQMPMPPPLFVMFVNNVVYVMLWGMLWGTQNIQLDQI